MDEALAWARKAVIACRMPLEVREIPTATCRTAQLTHRASESREHPTGETGSSSDLDTVSATTPGGRAKCPRRIVEFQVLPFVNKVKAGQTGPPGDRSRRKSCRNI